MPNKNETNEETEMLNKAVAHAIKSPEFQAVVDEAISKMAPKKGESWKVEYSISTGSKIFLGACAGTMAASAIYIGVKTRQLRGNAEALEVRDAVKKLKVA